MIVVLTGSPGETFDMQAVGDGGEGEDTSAVLDLLVNALTKLCVSVGVGEEELVKNIRLAMADHAGDVGGMLGFVKEGNA
jgi:hypothetical protein